MRLDAILESVRRDIVGHGATFGGAYGTKSLVYADYTASGRASRAVERCVARDVLPMYANTHTSYPSRHERINGSISSKISDCEADGPATWSNSYRFPPSIFASKALTALTAATSPFASS